MSDFKPRLDVLVCSSTLCLAVTTCYNVKILKDLKRIEIDLSLRNERYDYLEEISNILTGIFRSMQSYMAFKKNNFNAEQRRIKILERKAKYILDSESQKDFVEIITYISNILEDYRNFHKRRSDKKELYSISREMRDLQDKAMKNLEKLENKYLHINTICSSLNKRRKLSLLIKKYTDITVNKYHCLRNNRN